MLIAANWQWTRYHEKLELVEAYHNHEKSKPITLEPDSSGHIELSPYLHKKIRLVGNFDFSSQVAITNRRHAKGFGHWLMTPFSVQNSREKILISRGFIPYEDREIETWGKYNSASNEVVGVVQKSVSKRSGFSPSASMTLPHLFLYPDLALIRDIKIADINTEYYIQSISEPILNGYPSTDISIDVPPSTHFWYTFEWIGLSFLTLLISFLIQIFRPRRSCA